MKIYIAVICVVLLQGVHVNCQSSYMDTSISILNNVYQQYRSGNLLKNMVQIAVDFVGSIISKLSQLQSFIEKIPMLSQLPLSSVQSIQQPIQQAVQQVTQPGSQQSSSNNGRGFLPQWSG